MMRRQCPQQWLITDERMGDALLPAAARLPRGSGIILRHHSVSRAERARLKRELRRIAAARRLILLDEAAGEAARAHDPREVRQARLRGARLLLLSPLFETRSHPGQRPPKRMKAAALARLAGKPLVALGGMNARRFAHVERLGFDGWAAIDAWMGKASRE